MTAATRDDDIDEVTEALLRASRALVAVAARSLAAVDADVTLQQYRALVVLRTLGQHNLGALADALAIHSSTTTRLCDRLVAKGLISREVSANDRREVVLDVTRRGQRMVDRVTERRRRELTAIVERIPKGQRRMLVTSLQGFSEASNESVRPGASLGWATA